MANENILLEIHDPIIFADHATDYAGIYDSGTPVDVQLDMTSLGVGAARQSAKGDLAVSGALLAPEYMGLIAAEFITAPVSLETFVLYAGFSHSATAGSYNPGELSGSDSAYTGTTGDSLADSLPQLTRLDTMPLTADATALVQYYAIRRFTPLQRYIILVPFNDSSDIMENDAVESAIVLWGVSPEIQ